MKNKIERIVLKLTDMNVSLLNQHSNAMKPRNWENSWKWGIIYYNPDDPLIFVKKREESLGLTFNFAHWQSLVLTMSILAAIVFSVWLLG